MRILRLPAVLTLSLALSLGVFAQDALERAVHSIPPGKRVEVVWKDGQRRMGRMGSPADQGFHFTPEGKGQSEQIVRLDEVKSVKKRMTRGAKWGIAGVVYGSLVVIGLILGG